MTEQEKSVNSGEQADSSTDENTQNINADESDITTLSVRERFSTTLKEKAEWIKTARNDVYTTSYWQIIVNFVLGGGAIVALVLSMIKNIPNTNAWLGVGLGLATLGIVYNILLNKKSVGSFLQYTAKQDGKTYRYRIVNKVKSQFTDGENIIEVDRGNYYRLSKWELSQYSADFFKDIDPDVRIGKYDREIYKGTLDIDGKAVKAKIVFKNGVPFYGVIGGTRIKYFDVNDTREKFVVPQELIDAMKTADVPVPKLSGVHIKSGNFNAAKQ